MSAREDLAPADSAGVARSKTERERQSVSLLTGLRKDATLESDAVYLNVRRIAGQVFARHG